MAEDQPWMIVQEIVYIYDKSSAFVCCDRRQHLLILNYAANKTGSMGSNNATSNISDQSAANNGRSTCTADVQTVICLERIHYIQRGGGSGTSRRSARNYSQSRSSHSTNPYEVFDRQQRQLEIYYSTDYPRSEYLYKSVAFQLTLPEDKFDRWVNALYTVIDEAKNLNEANRRNRWLLREYEKLKRSSKGLTFDSINGWLNSHMGLVGEKKNVIKVIKEHEIFSRSNEITDSVFKAVYNHFSDKQQEVLVKTLMSDIIEENKISLEKFAVRLTNSTMNVDQQELDNIIKYLRLDPNQTDISLNQCINYLWSEANSVFDPNSRTKCTEDMNQPLNHYWISSSHNTYLAKTQIFNPASVHCYIQALLNGCRCVEIDVVDSRSGGTEPEVTHKNTRIKPILLREVLEAIHDYAFVTSEYPVIISIENHCSPEQRYFMSRLFVEIFGEHLVQSALSPDETRLPSPNQLKRRIILKDAKINHTGLQITLDSEEQLDLPSPGLVGHVQLYDVRKATWFQYNYWFKENDLFLAKDDEIQKQKNSNDDSSDEEHEENPPNAELTQIWYHRNLSHQDARALFEANSAYEIGTFLVRRSSNKNCYCITFRAMNSEVKSIEIKETRTEDGKCLYSLSQKKFESVIDLVSHYRTYDFAELLSGSSKQVLYRLGRPLPRATWRQELERETWYQPHLTREQAEELLSGLQEEMSFLIRESYNRARQDYTISVYSDNSIRHVPIYREGSDLMLMSKTFTSLNELVNYFSRKPIFQKSTLRKPAKLYAEFLNEQHRSKAQGLHQNTMNFIPLEHDISLKVDTLRTIHRDENSSDRSVRMQLRICEAEKKESDGYLLKFDTLKECNTFLARISSIPLPSSTMNRSFDDTSSISSGMEKAPAKVAISTVLAHPTQWCISEYNKLIIYCQGVKLKELNINKAHDLLTRIQSFKEMISLNYVKASAFCADLDSMIHFNQGHFTRVYPDFSRRSWSSFNFEPNLYWLAGCQMVALNFQTPDRPMHIHAGRFAANGGCGYTLMPNYIRFSETYKTKIDPTYMLLHIRTLAVRHLRTTLAKSILKVHVKTTVVNKQRPMENPSYLTTINGPCGIWDSKQSTRHQDLVHGYYRCQSEYSDVDLIYFDVSTDNQEFCGQSAIPLSSLRQGIRSVPLYDRFNERLEMSSLLVDIYYDTVKIPDESNQ